MIKLIKNELIKIFHKKSTYIMLGIMIGFIGLFSFIYSRPLTSSSYTSYEYYDGVEGIDVTINNEIKALYSKYSEDTWQYYCIDENFDIIYNYYYNKDNDVNIYEEEYKKFYEALENDNWKYFVNKDLEEEKGTLNEYKTIVNSLSGNGKNEYEKLIFQSEVKIEMLEYRLKENLAYGNDYLNEAIEMINNTSYSVKAYEYASEKAKNNFKYELKNYHEARYILDSKEEINDYQSLRYLLMEFFDTYSFIILVFGVMIGGSIVSDEYSKGTIKSLLITPYKRTSILMAKFITTFIVTIMFIVLAYLVQVLVGGIFFGYDSLAYHAVAYNYSTNSLEVMSILKYSLIKICAEMPEVILLMTLAFALSTIIGNTAFSVAITFAGSLGASIINIFATSYDIPVLKYFVTTNWDFGEYLFGATSQYGTSFTHAVIVCLVYCLIMVIISLVVFKKKNIKNI